MQWVIDRADPARWTYAGRAEAFFDETQIEVFGPFLVGGELGSPGEVSSALPAMLQTLRPLWRDRACDFLAD
ncbi:hypothetical protein G4L39_12985, partial [Limisphaera ngatamarikiensis]